MTLHFYVIARLSFVCCPPVTTALFVLCVVNSALLLPLPCSCCVQPTVPSCYHCPFPVVCSQQCPPVTRSCSCCVQSAMPSCYHCPVPVVCSQHCPPVTTVLFLLCAVNSMCGPPVLVTITLFLLCVVNSVCWAPHEHGLMLACASSDGSVSVLTYTASHTWQPTKINNAHNVSKSSPSRDAVNVI